VGRRLFSFGWPSARHGERAVQRRSLFAVMMGVGAAALAVQSLLIRELMVSFYGTEFALAAALACWLAFVALGALAGGLALRLTCSELGLVLASTHILAAAVVVQFLTARLVRPLFHVEAGAFPSLGLIMVGAALANGPVGFMVGFIFPALCAFEEKAAGARGRGITRIYVAEALGSCVCGAALSFLLLRTQPPIAIAMLAAASLLVLCGGWSARAALSAGFPDAAFIAIPALWLLSSPAGMVGGRLFAAVLAVVALGGFVVVSVRGNAARTLRAHARISLALAFFVAAAFAIFGDVMRLRTLRWRWQTFSRFEFVESRETQYQNIAVGRREEAHVVLQNGLQSVYFPDESTTAQQAALLLTQHPDPKSVLVIGGGLGGLCQQMLKTPVHRIDYVEMDPGLIGLVMKYLPGYLRQGLKDPRFVAYNCDGRYFVQNARARPARLAPLVYRAAGGVMPGVPYDLVVINLGDPASASGNRVYTQECFREVQGVLSPDGVLAVCGITGSENYLRGGVLAYSGCIYKTLRSVFPVVVIRPGDELCFFASFSKHSPTSDPDVLMDRFERLGLEPVHMKYMFALSQFPEERVRYARASFDGALERLPRNTDEHPLAFSLFLRVQEHYARQRAAGVGRGRSGHGSGLFEVVFSVRAWWLLVPFVAFLSLLAAVRAVFGSGRAAPLTLGFVMVTTGVFGISCEVLIMYMYQAQFGYVYRDISIIVGLFMLGLAAGGWLMGRCGPSPGRGRLLALESLQVVLLLGLPGLAAVLDVCPYLYMLLSAVAGFLTGGQFPLACRIGLGAGGGAGRIASVLDACDHSGAVLGAAATGLILMPVFGFVYSCLLLACIKSASLLGVVIWAVAPKAPRSARP